MSTPDFMPDLLTTLLRNYYSSQPAFWEQVVLALRRRHSDSYRPFLYVRRAIAWPIRKVVGIMHHILTMWMLTGIEIAIEYMLGLTYSPQVLPPDLLTRTLRLPIWQYSSTGNVSGRRQGGKRICACQPSVLGAKSCCQGSVGPILLHTLFPQVNHGETLEAKTSKSSKLPRLMMALWRSNSRG